MTSRATICLYRLRHTAVAAAAPAMISRATICLYRLRHTAVAAAAPAMISRAPRRSTVVAIAIVRNRSCDATAAATVQYCRRSSKQLRHIAVAAVAPSMISRTPSRSTVVAIAIVQNRSCDATAAATVQHCRRSSKQLRHSGCSGGPGYDIPCSPPQYSGSHCYRAKPFVRRYSGGDGTALSPQQQTTSSYSGRSGGPGYDIPCSPPQYSSGHYYRAKPFERHYSGGDGTALSPQQQPGPRPFYSFVRDQRYIGGHSTAPPQQPRPRPLSSFGWEQRGACRNGPPVNGLANSIAQGQAQRDVKMDCHGGPVSKVSGPPETTASLARGGPP